MENNNPFGSDKNKKPDPSGKDNKKNTDPNEDKKKDPQKEEHEKPGMGMFQVQKTDLQQRLENRQEYNWDGVLTKSESNPFPLAPKDLIEKGEVNEKNYSEQNAAFTQECFKIMSGEMEKLAALVKNSNSETTPKRIQILGAGLMRDLWWLLDENTNKTFKITILDRSAVAVKNAKDFLPPNVEVKKTDIEDALEKGEINEEETLAFYGGQFIQNQDRETMERMMRRFAPFLAMPSDPPRRLYFLHASGEDNPPEKVAWRNTIPYTEDDLRAPLEEALSGEVKMEVLGKVKYFHQTYTMYCITAAE